MVILPGYRLNIIVPSKNLFLTIDQGGHASRALIWDSQGCVIAKAEVEIQTLHPKPGWVEHLPQEMVASIRTSIDEALSQLGQDTQPITAAGMATQRSSIVCWNKKTGEPLSNIISWQDRRAHPWLGQFSNHAASIHEKTGLFLTAYYGASKLRWCLDHLSEVSKALEAGNLAFGPLASYLVNRLTTEHPHTIDPANASRTLLWNVNNKDWDPELLALFDIPLAALPQCVPSRHNYGHIQCGDHQVPLTVLMGDQPAALFARGQPSADTAYVNIGTGAFVQRVLGRKPGYSPTLLTGIAFQGKKNTTYVLEGTVNGAGSALEAIEQELGIDAKQAQGLAPQWLSQSSNPPLFLNGISGLGSPYWTPDFESRFLYKDGDEAEDWGKIVAVIESIIFLLYVNLKNMKAWSPEPSKIILSGGLGNLDGLCQRLADLTTYIVHRPQESEATARGTAFLVAQQNHSWQEQEPTRQFTPNNNPALKARYNDWSTAMEAALNP